MLALRNDLLPGAQHREAGASRGGAVAGMGQDDPEQTRCGAPDESRRW
jgi:hypothetical protein